MFTLEEQCALVTGARGGIGAAMARVLRGQGAALAFSGTRETVLSECGASIGGGNAHVRPCSLGGTGPADGIKDCAYVHA